MNNVKLNNDEMEIQFKEHALVDKEEDCMAQITFHFPGAEVIETEDGEEQYSVAPAEAFRNSIMELGVIKNITDKVIVEFTKEQGTALPTYSLTNSLTHSLTYLLTHSLTHPLTCRQLCYSTW